MKQTKENILQIKSVQEAEEFKRIAKGRKFCKIGERICDICKEEIERYNYEKCKNIFIKIFKHKKYTKQKMMIENRTSSIIRAIAADNIRKTENEPIDIDELIESVKKVILNEVEEYNRNFSKAG